MDGAQEGGPEQVAKLLPYREIKMKYVLVALFMLIVLPVKAQTVTIPIQCGSSQQVLETVKQRYQEELLFLSEGIAAGNKGVLYNSLWVNYETKTWSFIVINKKDETACLFASGKNFNFFEPGESI